MSEAASAEDSAGGLVEDLVRQHLREMGAAPDPDLHLAIFYIIQASMVISNDLERHVHRPRGWTFAGFNIMSAIAMLDDPEPSQVARLAGVSRPTVSSVLNTLEREGLVVRMRRSSDRRVVTLALTEHGEAAYREALVAVASRELEWMTRLNKDERHQLLELLRKSMQARPRSEPTPGALVD